MIIDEHSRKEMHSLAAQVKALEPVIAELAERSYSLLTKFDATADPAQDELDDLLRHHPDDREYINMADGSRELVRVLAGARQLRDAWLAVRDHASGGHAILDCDYSPDVNPDWLTRLQKEAADEVVRNA